MIKQDRRIEPAERHHMMTNEPVGKLIVSLALPTIFSMLVSSLYSMADTYFVSKIDISATAAVGVAFPLFIIIQAISMMLSMGAGSFSARLLGAGNVDMANRTVSTAFILSVSCGTIIGLFSIIFIEPLMLLLGATPTSLQYAVDYAFWIIIASPFFSASFVLNATIRQEGSAKLASIGMLSGSIINVILDPIFIFILDLGIVGAALATSISQIISFLILFYFVLRKKTVTRIKLSFFTPNKIILKEIFGMGTPAFFQQGLQSLSGILLNNGASFYGGDLALGSMQITHRIIMIIVQVILGFSNGFSPVCGYNYGAGKFERVKESFKFSQKTGIFVTTIIITTGILFAPQIISLFGKDNPDLIDIGSTILRIQFSILPFMVFIIISNSLFQACGKPIKAAIMSLTRQGLFFIPLIIILPRLFGLDGVIIAQPLANFISFLVSVPLTISMLHEINRIQKSGEVPIYPYSYDK
jgi:putative MATE family efflux protein